MVAVLTLWAVKPDRAIAGLDLTADDGARRSIVALILNNNIY